ncbi:hypothetical protein A6V36_38020 [Paraburkholderia ginsengiterrae]|uniref:Uncharacterized protein n=1 Tax=Paraburkholderia ginsengiterrae TaxID=1462993 RepID=A0ABX2UWZ0_9BURK|nr:hypothetical protein A6V36_38020 [Paraburkholderia ginsengiterrae]
MSVGGGRAEQQALVVGLLGGERGEGGYGVSAVSGGRGADPRQARPARVNWVAFAASTTRPKAVPRTPFRKRSTTT